MFNPKPKPTRFKDDNFSRKVRSRDGRCVAGLMMPREGERMSDGYFPWECSEGLDAHHITHRGGGGDDHLENGIALCRRHHQMAHSNQITRQQMRDWIDFLHGGKDGTKS